MEIPKCLEYLFDTDPKIVEPVRLLHIYGELKVLHNLFNGNIITNIYMKENEQDFMDRLEKRIDSIESEILRRMGDKSWYI